MVFVYKAEEFRVLPPSLRIDCMFWNQQGWDFLCSVVGRGREGAELSVLVCWLQRPQPGVTTRPRAGPI